jgi:hypothetical protein
MFLVAFNILILRRDHFKHPVPTSVLTGMKEIRRATATIRTLLLHTHTHTHTHEEECKSAEDEITKKKVVETKRRRRLYYMHAAEVRRGARRF